VGFWRKNTIHPKVLHSLCIRTIYNFTYRLSGDIEVAEVLTEKVLLGHPDDCNNDVKLLKHAWMEFVRYNWCKDCKGEEPVQRALLSLGHEQRCAVILHDILDFSYREIAVVLNTHESRVAYFISSGRQEITKSVKKPNITG
jgi:hypothetical protein